MQCKNMKTIGETEIKQVKSSHILYEQRCPAINSECTGLNYEQLRFMNVSVTKTTGDK